LIETYRGAVSAWECDGFGHLNIAFYVERFGDAALTLLERLPPGGDVPARRWRSRRIATRYVKELRAGDGLVLQSGVLGIEEGAVRLGHRADSADGAATTVVEHWLVPLGAAEGTVEALRAAVVAWPEQPFAPLSWPARIGPLVSGRDRVRQGEVNESGELSLAGFVHRFAVAGLQVIAAFGMTGDYMRRERRGLATFETRLDLAPESPRAGEGVVVSSSLLDVGNASMRMVHEMRAGGDGRLFARYYQAGVHFDLEARRSAPLPPELRERAVLLRRETAA
jgi:acyl-CoA thioester hydrolase